MVASPSPFKGRKRKRNASVSPVPSSFKNKGRKFSSATPDIAGKSFRSPSATGEISGLEEIDGERSKSPEAPVLVKELKGIKEKRKERKEMNKAKIVKFDLRDEKI